MTQNIVDDTIGRLKNFIAYETRLIYSCKYADEFNHRWNGNEAASVCISNYDPQFWIKQVLVKDNDDVIFFKNDGSEMNFDDLGYLSLPFIVDVSTRLENMYKEMVGR